VIVAVRQGAQDTVNQVGQEMTKRNMSIQPTLTAYFSPSWTAFQAERGRDFSVIVDGISN